MAMLKALWRRTTGQSLFHACNDDRGEVNLSEDLTHTGRYHLERLQTLLELRFHQAFDSDQNSGMRRLIHFASRIQDQDIQRELLLLYLNCPPSLQEYLRSDDLIEAGHYIHQHASN
ncbi:hypothetical protein CF392_05435 [Tamilnaduibacter salinus]|uniref:Uncharacterized protein n=2 Tax=Tamilnaduibacter salinus TaxID=1484056 RepID=A0A2A2I5Q9_9GAMM|nr:hypothetical protein CF392_05435 [Tamilnaduibacter salinus]